MASSSSELQAKSDINEPAPVFKTIFCYCHWGGETVASANGLVPYKGGEIAEIIVSSGMRYNDLVATIFKQLGMEAEGKLLHYTVKYDSTQLIWLKDQASVDNLIQFNDDFAHLYVSAGKVDAVASQIERSMRSRGSSNAIQRVASVGVENKADEKHLNSYLTLHKAAIEGDWERARIVLEVDPDAFTAKITKTGDRVLLVAATGQSIYFFEKLVEAMSSDRLALTNNDGDTALHKVAQVGNVKAAKLLVNKNPGLPNKSNTPGHLPIHHAAESGRNDMFFYLLSITDEDLLDGRLLRMLITSRSYDVALYLLKCYPKLAWLNNLLILMAQKPSAFPSGSRLSFWEQLIYDCAPVKFGNFSTHQNKVDVENPTDRSQVCAQACRQSQFFGQNHLNAVYQKLFAVLWNVIEIVPQIKHIRDTKLNHRQALELIKWLCEDVKRLDNEEASSILKCPFLLGAQNGIHEVVEKILESFPAAIYFKDDDEHDAFHLAVMNRHEKVFKVVYKMGEYVFLPMTVDNFGNNIYHLAGKLAPEHRRNLVTGAALQMQRELRWFKDLENFVSPEAKERKNYSEKTPAQLFTEAHKGLVKEGEEWLKHMAESCTVAVTLIGTVVFSAAITVPGGNNDDNGIPIFSHEGGFIIFATSNTICFCSSVFSLLMFLSIYTSHYAEDDFLISLPRKFIVGLASLFLSIATLMIAFIAICYLAFGLERAWILIPVTIMACQPVTVILLFQFSLLVDMLKSTLRPHILPKQGKRILQ